MAEKVKGYYSYFGTDLLRLLGVNKEGFIGAKCNYGITGNQEEDILLKTLQSNDIEVADYCENTGIVRVMFKTPIPVSVFREYEADSIPIFESMDKYLKL